MSQQFEAGAPIHRALDQLEAMHVSFDLSVAQGLREGCMDGGLITPKMSGEVNQRTGLGCVKPTRPRGSLTLPHLAEELSRQLYALSNLAIGCRVHRSSVRFDLSGSRSSRSPTAATDAEEPQQLYADPIDNCGLRTAGTSNCAPFGIVRHSRALGVDSRVGLRCGIPVLSVAPDIRGGSPTDLRAEPARVRGTASVDPATNCEPIKAEGVSNLCF